MHEKLHEVRTIIKNNNKKEKLRFVKGKYFVKSFVLAEQI